MKKSLFLLAILLLHFNTICAAIENSERSLIVDSVSRSYILYVPDSLSQSPALVISLHGAGGQAAHRSPFRISVADSQGCIVAYPQGLNQNFGPFGTVPGWDSNGTENIDLHFFKAIIDDVAHHYNIDRSRVYCCGFSNGGMMTYSNASTASDIFAAFASISGFQLNEFHQRHTGMRPVPFMHIHGKADDFVKHSLMPIICDNTTARNGCNPVPNVTEVPGKYTLSVYEAEEGGFPYVYYEIDGMWHSDFTDKTEEGNSALTMWKFMSQYTLQSPCDSTLKWRQNIDAEGFDPQLHGWTVDSSMTRFSLGTKKKSDNSDHNVYHSLQFEPGHYKMAFDSDGVENGKMSVLIESLEDGKALINMDAPVGERVEMPFSIDEYGEYRITIIKSDARNKFSSFAIYSCESPASPALSLK